MEHSPVRGTSRCAPGAFSLTAPVFIKPACAKRGLVRTGQHLGGRAWCARRVNYSQASSEPTAAPTPKATHQPHHQHQKPHTDHITSTRSHAPIKPAAPATSHINPQQPQHQHQKPHTDHITGAGKPRANQASSPGNTTHQPASTAAPTPGTSTRNHAPPAQRFLYCDGETPNISLKYFAKYFCVPKPTASETSTTLSPASVDNS